MNATPMTFGLNDLYTVAAILIEQNPNDEVRIMRAHDMFENGVRVERIDRNYFLVQSVTNDERIYLLDSSGCPCEDHTYRATTCKHMWCAVILRNLSVNTAALVAA